MSGSANVDGRRIQVRLDMGSVGCFDHLDAGTTILGDLVDIGAKDLNSKASCGRAAWRRSWRDRMPLYVVPPSLRDDRDGESDACEELSVKAYWTRNLSISPRFNANSLKFFELCERKSIRHARNIIGHAKQPLISIPRKICVSRQ